MPMGYLKPKDTVYKLVTLPRWQKEWINSHRSINFSGMVQMHVADIIKEYDPSFFKENEHLLKERMTRRKEQMREI